MNDETIFMCAAALVLAAAIAAGLLWARADRTRQRRADARDRARHPIWPPPPPLPTTNNPASFAPRVWPAGGAGGSSRQATVRRDTPVERGPFHRPSAPASPSPIYYGDPVPLDLSAVAGGTSDPAPAAFEGGGGSFGGGGASGGWDPPAAAPEPLALVRQHPVVRRRHRGVE